jgi:hypothetical protein
LGISHWSLVNEWSGSVSHMGIENSLLELSMVNGANVMKDVFLHVTNVTMRRINSHIKSILLPKPTHPGRSSRPLKSGLEAASPLERGASSMFYKSLEEAGCVAPESALGLDKMLNLMTFVHVTFFVYYYTRQQRTFCQGRGAVPAPAKVEQ